MHIRWTIATLLFLSVVVNYLDRQCLSVLAPVITKELGLSQLEYSRVLNAFLLAYTAMYLGSGFLVDRWGTRKSLGVFMAWWSVSNMLHAFASNVWSLGAFRFLLGLGEPGNFMAAFRAISECYEKQHRAFVNGLLNAGASIGAMLAPVAVTWLYLRFSWRGAFVICGVLGLLWLIPWLRVYRPLLERQASGLTDGRNWKQYLRVKQTWGLFGARLLSDPVWWFYLFWLPKYLVEQRGFTVQQMALVAWMPYLTADLGAMGGGWLSGKLVSRGWDVVAARRAVMVPASLVMPLSALVGFTPSSVVAVGIICLVTFAHMAWKTNLATVTNDIYPAAVVGRMSGIFAFGNGLGGMLFTELTGQVVGTVGYAWIFVAMGVLHPLGLLIFRALVKGGFGDGGLGVTNAGRAEGCA
ncbi:MAG: MFS transporter [Bryobacter sp.]|nr:MFS transporter [Bryobacter sp.]